MIILQISLDDVLQHVYCLKFSQAWSPLALEIWVFNSREIELPTPCEQRDIPCKLGQHYFKILMLLFSVKNSTTFTFSMLRSNDREFQYLLLFLPNNQARKGSKSLSDNLHNLQGNYIWSTGETIRTFCSEPGLHASNLEKNDPSDSDNIYICTNISKITTWAQFCNKSQGWLWALKVSIYDNSHAIHSNLLKVFKNDNYCILFSVSCYHMI